jgi:hypothetical protein
MIEEIHKLAENFANMAALNQAEQRAAQTTKDAEKVAAESMQMDLIRALTMRTNRE